ncbi:hypothetical protein MFIFM68171_08276 [Madurella fahalii]|uniref:SGNH hydrolase-type esterase domain-containing protein n=1 Tax=Madurella fahalii TaxID=1157608 RepID=A0ABQ0GK16_9PEZI
MGSGSATCRRGFLFRIAALCVSTALTTPQLIRRAEDPMNFGWVEKWAAIGDSFTAGIGSGRQLGNMVLLDKAWKCSRYDYSWPQVVNQALGSSVDKFQFEACSGDRTGGIYDQVDELDRNLDLVMMTAGGNDLCLGAMIKTCIIMPFDGEESLPGNHR